MTAIKPYAQYRATIKIRRGEGWDVKPEAEEVDGMTLTFRSGYPLEGEDHSDLYTGEWAMIPNMKLREFPVSWIASGDLSDIMELVWTEEEVAGAEAEAAEILKRKRHFCGLQGDLVNYRIDGVRTLKPLFMPVSMWLEMGETIPSQA